MGLSVWQLLIVALVILVLFGRGRISEMMGDFGKGIKSFKQGMNEDEAGHEAGHEAGAKPAPRIEAPSTDANPAHKPAEETSTKN